MTRSPAPDPPLTPRARAFVEATLRVIGRVGVDAVTHRAVAAEAGVSSGAIAHHFATRAALVEAALRHAVARELERLGALSLRLQADAFDRARWARRLAAWYARELETNADAHIACYEAFLASARRPRYRALVRRWFDAFARTAELVLRAAGSRRPAADARVLVATVTGLILGQLAERRAGFQGRARQVLLATIEGLTGR